MIVENNIFIVGIKGVAMTNLAIILKKMGKKVSGSDTAEEFITSASLEKNSIFYVKNFDKENLPKNTDLVIYSAAHRGISNPQVQEAILRKIKVQSQPEVLNDLMLGFTNTLAVCGCHGKTTTSSLLAYSLIGLGANPSYLIGSSGFNQFAGGDYQDKDYFVIEADEYGVNPPIDKTPKLNFLKPKYVVCTNIDFDHPDVYQNIDEIKKTFLEFFAVALQRKESKIFICIDDKNSVEVAKKLKKESYFTYGFGEKADYRIINYKTNKSGSSFILVDLDNNHYDFRIGLFGEKNISNVAGVIGLLFTLGFSSEKIKLSIEGFIGAKRRFEKIAYINDIYLFDDYAHHPKEIESTITAIRSRFHNKRIVLIYQPHTYSRTKALLEDFRRSLSMADLSLLLPIFPSARENAEDFQISSKDILASAYDSKQELLEKLPGLITNGDVIFTMGAGDVYKLKDDIIKIIKSNF